MLCIRNCRLLPWSSIKLVSCGLVERGCLHPVVSKIMQLQCRMSRPSSSELCGRITMFLTPLLPLLDRSGLNVPCAFNDSHSTPVEDVPEVSPPPSHAIPKTEAPRRRMCPAPVRSMCNAPSTTATPHPLRMYSLSSSPHLWCASNSTRLTALGQ
jgi:hypothetical protein